MNNTEKLIDIHKQYLRLLEQLESTRNDFTNHLESMTVEEVKALKDMNSIHILEISNNEWIGR